MARAGGQIFRDVLRRKLNAQYDNPNYDDQGQEMETPDYDEPDWAPGTQVTKKMRRPNPDGTFDGPSGGRPAKSNYGGGLSDLEMREEERMNADTDDGHAPAEDYMNQNSDDGMDFVTPRLKDAGMRGSKQGGDQAIIDAIVAEAEKLASEGVPLETVLATAPELADPYSTGDEQQTRELLKMGYTKGLSGYRAAQQNQMNKNMGKPFR